MQGIRLPGVDELRGVGLGCRGFRFRGSMGVPEHPKMLTNDLYGCYYGVIILHTFGVWAEVRGISVWVQRLRGLYFVEVAAGRSIRIARIGTRTRGDG